MPLASLAQSAVDTPDELTMAELGAQMHALARTGQDNTAVAFNYYAKLGLPLLCLAFALCAPPLALRFARAGAYMGIFLSIIMVWVAWNTLLLTKILGLDRQDAARPGRLVARPAVRRPGDIFPVAGGVGASAADKKPGACRRPPVSNRLRSSVRNSPRRRGGRQWRAR